MKDLKYINSICVLVANWKLLNLVKFPYWGVLNYANNLCIKISPIFYMANPNPNPTGASKPQCRNYPEKTAKFRVKLNSL